MSNAAIRHFVAGCLSVAVVLGGVDLVAQERGTLVFGHTLKDSRGDPVGGVFWMKFSLHRGMADVQTVWSEELPVAVDMGNYLVELGKDRPIPADVPSELYLSVALEDTEIVRVPVAEHMWSMGPDGVSSWRWSATAAREAAGCASCDKAKEAANCERLQGMTFQQLEKTVAQRSVSIGSGVVRVTSVVEGTGAGRWVCPPGFVLVGMEGSLQGDADSPLQMLCAPLETR